MGVATVGNHAEETGHRIRQTAERPWVAHCARAGFAARALVYATIGVLAGRAALGDGGKTTDTHGAIQSLGEGTFGQVVLVLVALGLTGYAVWRFIQGIVD